MREIRLTGDPAPLMPQPRVGGDPSFGSGKLVGCIGGPLPHALRGRAEGNCQLSLAQLSVILQHHVGVTCVEHVREGAMFNRVMDEVLPLYYVSRPQNFVQALEAGFNKKESA